MKDYLENILHISRNVSKSISFIFIKKAPFIRVVFVEYLFSNFWKLIYSNMDCMTYFNTNAHLCGNLRTPYIGSHDSK